MTNDEPYTHQETDYAKLHPTAARLREEGRRHYEDNRGEYEAREERALEEHIKDYEEGLRKPS